MAIFLFSFLVDIFQWSFTVISFKIYQWSFFNHFFGKFHILGAMATVVHPSVHLSEQH